MGQDKSSTKLIVLQLKVTFVVMVKSTGQPHSLWQYNLTSYAWTPHIPIAFGIQSIKKDYFKKLN